MTEITKTVPLVAGRATMFETRTNQGPMKHIGMRQGSTRTDAPLCRACHGLGTSVSVITKGTIWYYANGCLHCDGFGNARQEITSHV